ncbi:unnamed protein product [Mytilus edulis]|uniref:Uncharacterized protein n=1 Tax=Mytilus edulis TaxID=6550 RepID=A0A8S3T8A3_MYTED|nr:unnamed protein product [Mytilus edulis]
MWSKSDLRQLKANHVENAMGCSMVKDVSPNVIARSTKINSVTPTLPVYTESHLVPTEQPSDRSESVTVYGTAIAGSTESTRNNGFQLELLIYSASVTGVVLILGICYLCKKYNPRRKKSKASVTLDEEITQNDPPNESHEVFELNEGLYHTIDEDKISISSINDNPYLEVVNGSSGSDSIKNDKGEIASYPPPYCRQITTSVDNHPYENSRPESHEQIFGIQETDQDYLTPNKNNN